MPAQLGIVSPSDDEPTPKRRKVRKGTQSCWECKRRKVRCIFTPPAHDKCDNCVRRKTSCIGQEYSLDTEPVTNGADHGVEDRLSRVEEILEQLITNIGTTNTEHGTNDLTRDRFTPHVVSSPGSNATDTTLSQASDTIPHDRYTGLARDLVAAWPSQRDLDRIHELPIGYSTHMHMTLSRRPAEMSQGSLSTREVLQLPPPGAHPVLIARKLLFLGSLLQGSLSATGFLDGMQNHFSEVMSRAVDTAIRLVTTNDKLTASVEGVECIMIEAMFQNYTGDLHLAWQTVRRASAVAQMIGLHRSSESPTLKFLDPDARAGFDKDQLCFRITEMDGYLSMTLGLPKSPLQSRAFSPEVLAKCQPIDRLSRLHCIICGHILAQNEGQSYRADSVQLDRLDRMIQDAAAEMQPQWWLIPDLEPNQDLPVDPFHDITRVHYQFSHYNLLMLLHLPYVLRSSTDSEFDHSKITAVHASREILSRYIVYRKLSPSRFYCRGIDYLAFMALAILCVSHINAYSLPKNTTISSTNVSKILAQSHPSDRGMMERVLCTFEKLEDDTIASKLRCIIKHLLDVESDASNGGQYSTTAIEGDDRATECDGRFLENNNTLQLHIPYFGTINLKRRIIQRWGGPIGTVDDMVSPAMLPAHRMPMEWDTQWLQQPSELYEAFNINGDGVDSTEDWTLQSINESLFGSLLSGNDDQLAIHNEWTTL